MDSFAIGLFLVAAFAGGFASGLAGFAMGFVVSGVWLHLISPLQTTTLIIGFSLITQSYGVWKLRKSLRWRTVMPFIIGGAIGVPVGTLLLTYIQASYLRAGVGLLLMTYGAYGLVQPAIKPVHAAPGVDGSVGFLNGLLCGLTGLPGFIITVWCQLRGWPKDVQRTVFQPVMLGASTVTGLSLAISGAVTIEIAELYALGLPALLAGLWVGFRLYGRLDDAAFRKVLLWLLLASGAALIGSQLGPISSFQNAR